MVGELAGTKRKAEIGKAATQWDDGSSQGNNVG